MNNILVTGGKSYQKEIMFKAAQWLLKELLPRYRTIDLEISLEDSLKKEGAYGFCEEVEKREFVITVDKTVSLRNMIATLAHEMVHMKQHIKGELKYNPQTVMWKSKTYSYDHSYKNQPWEKEAFRLEMKLTDKMWSEDII